LQSFYNRCEIITQLRWKSYAIVVKSQSNRFSIIAPCNALQSLQTCCEIAAQSVNKSRNAMRQLRNRCGSAAGSLQSRCTIAVNLLLKRYAIAAESLFSALQSL
jgi:hypothetical protein